MRFTIKVDYENNAELFWDTIARRKNIPFELAPVLEEHKDETTVEVTTHRAKFLKAWCAKVPGWADGPAFAKTALLFDEGDE